MTLILWNVIGRAHAFRYDFQSFFETLFPMTYREHPFLYVSLIPICFPLCFQLNIICFKARFSVTLREREEHRTLHFGSDVSYWVAQIRHTFNTLPTI